MRRRQCLAAMAAGGLLGPLALHSHAQGGKQWHFDVWLGETRVGNHHFDLSGEGDIRELRSLADLDVKLLGISLFRYHHESNERWQGNCLLSIDSRTRENKRELWVKGQRRGDGFDLSNRDGETRLPGCVMTYAYWNPQLVSQTQLLNPQNGKLLTTVVTDKGDDAVVVRGKPVPAHRYEIATKGSPIEIWYADGGTEWVALASTIGGQRLRYRLV